MTDDRPHSDDPERPEPPGEADAADRGEGDREAAAQMAQDPDAPGVGAAEETDDLGDTPEPNEPA